MTIQEAVHDLNETFQNTDVQYLKNKIKELEAILTTQSKVIINLANRLDYLESKCQ